MAKVKKEPGPRRPPEHRAVRPRAVKFGDRRLKRPKDASRSFRREEWA